MQISNGNFFKVAVVFVFFAIGAFLLTTPLTVFSKAAASSARITGTVVLLDDMKATNNSIVAGTGNQGTGFRDPYLPNVLSPVALPGDPANGSCQIKVTGCCAADYSEWNAAIPQATTRSLRFDSLLVTQAVDNRLANCMDLTDNTLPPGVHDVELSCGSENPLSGPAAKGYGGTPGYLAVAYSCPV